MMMMMMMRVVSCRRDVKGLQSQGQDSEDSQGEEEDWRRRRGEQL
jgi:hypothetical protein